VGGEWGMRRITVGLLLATLALALSACGPGSRSQAAPSGPPESGTPTAPAPSDEPSPSAASPSSAASAVLVQFGRQGGFAGVSDQLTVRQDGGFTLVRTRPAVNRTGRLSAADLAELRQVLPSADIARQSTVQAAKGNDLY